MSLPETHASVVRRLVDDLDGVTWALTGSTSFALQGVPVDPRDVDVQTSAHGAYRVEEQFDDCVVEPVTRSTHDGIRSHLGVLSVEDLRVEVMGGLQKRDPGDEWEPPTDLQAHREYVTLDDRRVPVLSLAYEAAAYERLGRDRRAALLREHVDP